MEGGDVQGAVSIHAPLARSNADHGPRKRFTLVSIHAPLARSNSASCLRSVQASVSIHAPLARSNISCFSLNCSFSCFNTCSSCEEQQKRKLCSVIAWTFQYMLLLRGATILSQWNERMARGFNTCSSCEEQLIFALYRTRIKFQYMLLLRGAT